jgi:hypothetical protein
VKKILCVRDHRMIEVVDGLWLCECASYGRLASLKGAEEEARRIVDRAGGLGKMRDAIELAEAMVKEKRERARKGAALIRSRPG